MSAAPAGCSAREEKLCIAGRDRTALLDGLARRVDAVRGVLADADAEVAVRGALCFVGTELPWTSERIGGVPLVGRRGFSSHRIDTRPASRIDVVRVEVGRWRPTPAGVSRSASG